MTPVQLDSGKPLLLIFPFEQLAHYLRCLTLAKNIASYFDIRFVHSDRYAAFVAQEGFETFDCPGLNADEVLECVKRFDFSWMRVESLEQAFLRQCAAIENWRPALVLGDAAPTLKLAAEKTGVPYVSLMNSYLSPYYAGVRKMSWRYPLYTSLKILPDALLNPLTKWGEKQTFQKIHQPFRTLRKKYGLLKKCAYTDELQGDLNLLCDLPDLFPLNKLPTHYQTIAPLLYESLVTNDALLKETDGSKKTLFVSMGSTGDWSQVAFLNDPLFQKYNIITAGDKAGVIHAPHVNRTTFVNARQLFPYVDLVLCHGGNGTIYQALQAGIPVLCKTAHCEQEWNVQALEKIGAGASMDKLQSSKDHFEMIEAWMGKKGNAPLDQLKQQLATPVNYASLMAQLQRMLPAIKTMYPETEISTIDVENRST